VETLIGVAVQSQIDASFVPSGRIHRLAFSHIPTLKILVLQ